MGCDCVWTSTHSTNAMAKKRKHKVTSTREDALNIFTDGSSFSGPRVGGYGIVLVHYDDDGDEIVEEHSPPGYQGATNNQMELLACVMALKHAAKHRAIRRVQSVYIFSDSKYVVDNYKNAMFQWSRNGWMTAKGNPVANAADWKSLIREARKIGKRVEFEWVKGHAKSAFNKSADKLARASAKSATNAPRSVVAVRRKTTEKSVDVSSVEMRGQRLRVRIITTEYQPMHKLTKFRYEVISKGSKYFGNVDFIYSDLDMRAGHHYEISVNRETSRPRVLSVIRELER